MMLQEVVLLELVTKNLQVKFFMTYVLTSGWTSLACEVVQLYPLLCNFIYKVILRKDHGPFDGEYTFPYHSEVPRILLFGLLGLSFSILAPLILPLLLVYFCLAYLVYRNQVYFLVVKLHCFRLFVSDRVKVGLGKSLVFFLHDAQLFPN